MVGKKNITGASVRKKEHCHLLQHDSKENTNSEQLKQLKLPQGTLEENTEAGMTSCHPLLLHAGWGSRSWCQHPGEKQASEQLQADQLSNSASLCASLGMTRQVKDNHIVECGDIAPWAWKLCTCLVGMSGGAKHLKGIHENHFANLWNIATHNSNKIKFCKSGQTPKALEFGWTQSSLILPLTLSFPCRLNQKAQIIPGCSFSCCP